MIPRLFPNIEDDFFGDNMLSKFFEVQRDLCIPAVNVFENPSEYRIELAAPGMKKADFNVQIEKNTITISSGKKVMVEKEEEKNLRREFCYHSFKRCFGLPEDSDSGNIKASYTDGILTVSIPKMAPEGTKPKEIKID